MSKPTRNSNLSFAYRIAGRYLFSKKSHNVINVISGISAVGVTLGTLALVVVLSVFNGFETLVGTMFGSLDADLKIESKSGKSFEMDSDAFQKIKGHPSVARFVEMVEDNALARYKSNQMPVLVKGVDSVFVQIIRPDSIIYDGEFQLFDGLFNRSVVGIGVATTLGLGAKFVDPLFLYAPRRSVSVNLLRPDQSFNESVTYLAGIFGVNQAEYDNQVVFVPIKMARELFEFSDSESSSVALDIKDGEDLEKVKSEIHSILGGGFTVKNQYEQQAAFFNIMQIEKWITFLILSFILLIASFNIIGSLSMLIIDKKADIQTLRSLGADNSLINKIFLFEGWMISSVGAILGIVLGTLISWIQETFQIVRLGSGYVVDAYPVVTSFTDIIIVFFTVLTMGFLASWYPVRYLGRKLKSAGNNLN